MTSKQDRSPYESVLALTALLLLVYYFFYPSLPFLAGVIAFIIVTLLSKTVAKYVDILWDRLTKAIGWVSSRVLMGTIFFIFLTPLALLYRLFNKDTLQKRNTEDSLFIDRNHDFSAKDLENPW